MNWLDRHCRTVNGWIGRHPVLFWLIILGVLVALKVKIVIE